MISKMLVNLKKNRLADFEKSSIYGGFTRVNDFKGSNSSLMFSDLVGSITNNTVLGYKRGSGGHATSYYSRSAKITQGLSDGHLTEAFANLTSLLGSENSKVWRKILEYHVPDSLREYDRIMEHLARVKI